MDSDLDGSLALSGYKTVGVSLGADGGLGIEQVTRVALAGEVTGIIVNAELSDQTNPVCSEGTTQDVEEIDRIVVSARSSNWQGFVGDVNIGVDAGDFGTIRRQAVGVHLSLESTNQSKASSKGLKFSGTYARPRGKYKKVLLRGIDGVQGPYLLLPSGCSEQILPGSERVFLDGRLLTRGWDEDYIIDYSAGEVFFTSRRVIDRLSRIEVEFQYIVESFHRLMVGGIVEWRPGPGSARVAVLREADDPGRRLLGELTEEEEEHLSRIGRDTLRAWLSGANFVGAGAGEYIAEGNHFRYVGAGLGDYDVQFTFVGDSLGRYVYDDSLLGFCYVGEGIGDYVDSVRIELPQSNDIGYLQAGISQGRLLVQADAAFQRRCLNMFAGTEADVNAGAFSVYAVWGDTTSGVELRHVQQAAGFDLLSETRRPEFARRWAGTTEDKRRVSDELTVRLKPWRWMDLKGDMGRLVRSNGQPIDRWAAGVRFAWLVGELEKAEYRRSRYVGLVPVLGIWRGEIGWRVELDTVQQSQIWSAGAGFRQREPSLTVFRAAGMRYQLITHGDTVGQLQNGNIGPVHRLQADLDVGVGEVFDCRADVGSEKLLSGSIGNGGRLFGTARVGLSPVRGVRLLFDLGQSNRLLRSYSEQFYYVGKPRGSYSRDSLTGRFIPDPGGDYERRLVATNRFTSAHERAMNGSVEVSRLSWLGLTSSLARSVTATDSGLTREAFRYDLRATSNTLDPLLSICWGLSGEGGFDKTLVASGRHDVRHVRYAEVSSSRLPELELRGRVEYASVRHWYTAALVDYDESSWKLEFMPVVGVRLRLELTAGFEQSSIAEQVVHPSARRFSLSSLELGAARAMTVLERARVRVSGKLVSRRASVKTVPLEVSLTRPLGITPSVVIESGYVLSRVVDLSILYRFSRRPDRAAEHSFSSELRAYF
ncbi:MAG: hypothetical protein ABIK43_04830 [candidate division WOR-3 bacterium]